MAMKHSLLNEKDYGVQFGLLMEGPAWTWYEYFSHARGCNWELMKHDFIKRFEAPQPILPLMVELKKGMEATNSATKRRCE